MPRGGPILPFEERPTLAKRLTQARLALGLSQQEVAERAGLRPNYVTQLETGKISQPSDDKLAVIAWVLGVSLDDLRVRPHPPAPGDADAAPAALPEPSIFTDPTVPWQVKEALRPWARKLDPAVLRVLAGALGAAIGQAPAEEVDRELGPSKQLPPHDARDQDAG